MLMKFEEFLKETLKFSDGMEFDTSGELHTEERSDGWYVVGQGMLIPVESREEGEEWIKNHGIKESIIADSDQEKITSIKKQIKELRIKKKQGGMDLYYQKQIDQLKKNLETYEKIAYNKAGYNWSSIDQKWIRK